MAYIKIDPAKAESYPPNIQAILKAPSPASAYLGLELLELDTENLRVRLAFNAEDRLCNKWGGIHGGMVAAMLDDLMAIAVGLSLEWGEISPTLEMKASFIAAGRPGRLTGEGWTVKRGKSSSTRTQFFGSPYCLPAWDAETPTGEGYSAMICGVGHWPESATIGKPSSWHFSYIGQNSSSSG